MANEFRHGDVVAGRLPENTYEAIGEHIFNSQATGDMMYASSPTQLSRLAAGTTGRPLIMGASLPQWGGNLIQADSDKVIFGTDSDISMYWNNTDTKFVIKDVEGNNVLWYNRLAAGFGTWSAVINRDYDDASQAPAFNIAQTGNGEAVFRWQHADKPAANYDWYAGVQGRGNGGVIRHHWMLFLDQDGSAFGVRGLTAAEQGAGSNLAGRVLFFHNFNAGESEQSGGLWVCDPAARVEVRGNHDEVQLLAKGWTTQTSAIFDVQNSGGASLFKVPNASSVEINNTTTTQGLLINSTQDGVIGAALRLRATSASPAVNDLPGEILFEGYNDAVVPELIGYARIACRIADETDGTEDGRLDFFVMENTTENLAMWLSSPGLLNLDKGVNADEYYQVAGAQVVGARVIDVRCDDALNTGDATSDGVIDSLRDAMITHGLIAAA